MTDRAATAALAAELAIALADTEPLGLSGRALANRVHRRRADVLATLRSDPRFQHTGQGRRSRWRLTATALSDGSPEHTGTEEGRCPHCGLPLPPGSPDGAGGAGGEQEA